MCMELGEMKTLDMRLMRYLNLFEKITGVRTTYCFLYSGEIIFVIPSSFLSRAIGEEGKNVRKLGEILGRKIKVLALPRGEEDAREFISSLIYPLKVRSIDLTPGELIIHAGRQSNAMLIGRNKVRLQEMQEIVREYFKKEVKIV